MKQYPIIDPMSGSQNIFNKPQTSDNILQNSSSSLRVALYSHDTMGLGHMRRNMLIAQSLSTPPTCASVLLLGGAKELSRYSLPPGVDCLTLPAFYKNSGGTYSSRSLKISLNEIRMLRSQTILAALNVFNPHLLIVDKVPQGALGELIPALDHVKKRLHTRCILGLRDILDDPGTAKQEWSRGGNDDAIKKYYNAVWVYGDQRVYDLVREYGLSSETASKLRYTGYLNPRKRYIRKGKNGRDLLSVMSIPRGPLALCIAGGGQDGFEVEKAFARADLPDGMSGLVVTGPFMPSESRNALFRESRRRPRLHVVDFIDEPTLLIGEADRVVTMGGYNSICEILTQGKPSLIVPRVRPRKEQLIRACVMSRLKLFDMILPDELRPEKISRWLHKTSVSRPTISGCDFNGLSRIPEFIRELVRPQEEPVQTIHPGERSFCVH